MKTSYSEILNLSERELLDGMRLCAANSHELFASAELLASQKHFGSATALLVLSVEELVKAYALFLLITDRKTHVENIKVVFQPSRKLPSLHKTRLKLSDFINNLIEQLDFIEKYNNLPKNADIEMLYNHLKPPADFEYTQPPTARNNWFSQANSLKESGLYVSLNRKTWMSPASKTKGTYLNARDKISTVREMLTYSIESLSRMTDEERITFLKFSKGI